MRIAITGEKGFLGIHLTKYFREGLGYEVVELGRDYLTQLKKVKQLDWLIHGACVHRHENSDTLIKLNRKLTNGTLLCLLENNIQCNIVHLSSIHENSETAYGISKREANKVLESYCKKIKKEFISYKLPNVYGQKAVPNKTSFIATFCYNLHMGFSIKYNANQVQLAYVDDVVPIIASFQISEIKCDLSTVENIYKLLSNYHEITVRGGYPHLHNKFESNLYQTYLSYSNYKI